MHRQLVLVVAGLAALASPRVSSSERMEATEPVAALLEGPGESVVAHLTRDEFPEEVRAEALAAFRTASAAPIAERKL